MCAQVVAHEGDEREPLEAEGAAADPSRTGAAESRPADFSVELPALVPFEDAEETAEVCRFVADVGEQNSGAADVACMDSPSARKPPGGEWRSSPKSSPSPFLNPSRRF